MPVITSSGSIDFQLNRDQIILSAFRKCGAFASGETPDAQSNNDAAIALNALVKHWETSGIHLWTESEGTLWLAPGVPTYFLGGAVSSPATLSNDYVATTLTTSASSGASTIVVDDTTGFASGYSIGVVLDDGSLFWATESGAPAGSTITLLATTLTDSATAGNLVFAYATQLERPLRIVSARRIAWNATATAQVETPMGPMMPRLDYRNLPNKFAQGTPNQCFYDPQLDTGVLNVWPAPSDSLSGINFTFYRTVQDFDIAADTSDLPVEWTRALIWNLAVDIAPEYDCPPQRYQMLQERAESSLNEVRGWDREPESIYMGPALEERSGN